MEKIRNDLQEDREEKMNDIGSVLVIKKDGCGANAEGGGGFQTGNTCATGEKAKDNAAELARLAREKEGFSYNPVTGKTASEGYALSVFPEHERKLESIDDATPEAIVDYVIDKWDAVKDIENVHVGAWWNKKSEGNPDGDNKVYLDMSIILDDRAEAEKLAKEYRQLAIWDLGKGESIQTMTPEERAAAERAAK